MDAPIGGTPPVWNDDCQSPPGATDDGCVVGARLSRLTAAGDVMTGPEEVLIEDWCQQFPSHSIGTLDFGADGALYVSAGDGASFTFVDYGQNGFPARNPCNDPPTGIDGFQTPPTAEGGALRSQDLRTLADPVGYNGTILRVDPRPARRSRATRSTAAATRRTTASSPTGSATRSACALVPGAARCGSATSAGTTGKS